MTVHTLMAACGLSIQDLTYIPLTWKKLWSPDCVRKWQVEFNWVRKCLMFIFFCNICFPNSVKNVLSHNISLERKIFPSPCSGNQTTDPIWGHWLQCIGLVNFFNAFFHFVQGDQNVFLHLAITVKSSGSQRPFDHSILYPPNAQ